MASVMAAVMAAATSRGRLDGAKNGRASKYRYQRLAHGNSDDCGPARMLRPMRQPPQPGHAACDAGLRQTQSGHRATRFG